MTRHAKPSHHWSLIVGALVTAGILALGIVIAFEWASRSYSPKSPATPVQTLLSAWATLTLGLTAVLREIFAQFTNVRDAHQEEASRTDVRKQVDVGVDEKVSPVATADLGAQLRAAIKRKDQYKSAYENQLEKATELAVALSHLKNQNASLYSSLTWLRLTCAMFWASCAMSIMQLCTSLVATTTIGLLFPNGVPGAQLEWWWDKFQLLLLVPATGFAAGIGYRYYRRRTGTKGGVHIPFAIGYVGICLGGVFFTVQMSPELVAAVRSAGFRVNFGSLFSLSLDKYLILQRIVVLPLVGLAICLITWSVSRLPKSSVQSTHSN